MAKCTWIVNFVLILICVYFAVRVLFSPESGKFPSVVRGSLNSIPNFSISIKRPPRNGDPPFVAHFVRLYNTENPDHSHQLCFTECISLLSVIIFLIPDQILIHTNKADFWPLYPCKEIIQDFSTIKLVHRKPKEMIGNHSVPVLHHRADIMKLEILQEYGGVVLDSDVFILKGRRIKKIYRKYECILSYEHPWGMNAGFAACHKGAEWPEIILDYYRRDYRVDWLHNSARMPYAIWKANEYYFKRKNYLDNTVANNPSGITKWQMWTKNNMIDWKAKLGYHSFFHFCDFGLANLTVTNSSFGHLMRFVIENGVKYYNKTKKA